MMFMRTRRFALCCLSVGIASLLQPAVAWAQLDEHCTVSVLNRTAQVKPDGSWRIENIPTGFGQVRARATCVVDGLTLSGESQLFDISPNILAGINADITFEFTTPIPQTLALTAGATTLFQPGAVTSLTVMASYAEGPPQNVTLASSGTTYLSTNPAIATVSANGLVTAVRSGTVLIRASNEGTAGLITIQVLLSADTDGDGIADDVEVREGLNPNDPTDGLQDTDHDGLSNSNEVARGTDLRNPDTDGDTISDGEEVVAGADGFVTNPLLADTDGDGVRDALEIATGTDPTNSASFNLALAMSRIDVTPQIFVLTVNSIIGEASVQLAVIGRLIDGTSLDLTVHATRHELRVQQPERVQFRLPGRSCVRGQQRDLHDHRDQQRLFGASDRDCHDLHSHAAELGGHSGLRQQRRRERRLRLCGRRIDGTHGRQCRESVRAGDRRGDRHARQRQRCAGGWEPRVRRGWCERTPHYRRHQSADAGARSARSTRPAKRTT